MNYDFLQSYNIPTTPHQSTDNQYTTATNYTTIEGAYGTYSTETTPAVNTDYYGYGGGSNAYNQNYVAYPDKNASAAGSAGEAYQNPNRFIPPSKHGTGYTPTKPPLKRKYNTGPGKKPEAIVEVTSDGKLVLFVGRDESYPDELNALIHPLTCDLCNIKMNSRTSAKDHYESKPHDKNISSWLCKNYTEKGLNPPAVKRFIKQGPCGPDAFYCETCDLKLTSLTHAHQHYAGKKHQMVLAQRAKPSGAGYYNSEGKWVRTGTKLTPNQYKDRRYGIGENFHFQTGPGNEKSINDRATTPTPSETTTSIADTTTTSEFDVKPIKSEKTKPIVATDQDPSLFCTVCKVSVTSAVQMNMHLSGIKHQKKLKLSGVNPTTPIVSTDPQSVVPPTPIVDNVLFSAIKEEIKPDPTDLSMYRTPSGQYYCKTCNTTISHLPGLEQHLKGKRHIKKQTEEKAIASLAAKKIN